MNSAAAANRWLIRLAGIAAVAVFLGLLSRYWDPVYGFTALLQLDSSNDSAKIAAFREQHVYVYHDTGGYDGLYYAQIAYHPALEAAELRTAIDSLSYRARRILVPALAWLLAGGNPAWIVHIYSVINVVAWLVLAGLLWQLLDVRDVRGWLAWAGLLFSAGASCSVRFALTDLTALVLVTGALLAVERQRRGWATGLLAAAGLARETSLLAFTGIGELPWRSKRNFRYALLVAAPLGAWLIYIRWRVGSLDPGTGNFSWPVAGLIQKWHDDVVAAATSDLHLIAWSTLLATIGLTVQAAFFLTRWQPTDRWWRLGVSYTVFMLCLGTAVWEGFPGAATRVLLPLSLAFNVLVHRTRAPLAWLLAGNLTVAYGLLALTDARDGSRELATARSHGTTCVARLDDQWFARERTWWHTRVWSREQSTVAFEASPLLSQTVQLSFAARSLVPRVVVIRQDGRELSRVSLGPNRTLLSLSVILLNGRATLEFSTDTPGVPENAAPGARVLAFAVYDARLELPKQ